MNEMQRKIEATLTDFWNQRVIPSTSDASGIPAVALDSLSACEVLLDVDPIVGKKIPVEGIIRKGGYETREQFIGDLTDAIMAHIRSDAS